MYCRVHHLLFICFICCLPFICVLCKQCDEVEVEMYMVFILSHLLNLHIWHTYLHAVTLLSVNILLVNCILSFKISPEVVRSKLSPSPSPRKSSKSPKRRSSPKSSSSANKKDKKASNVSSPLLEQQRSVCRCISQESENREPHIFFTGVFINNIFHFPFSALDFTNLGEDL